MRHHLRNWQLLALIGAAVVVAVAGGTYAYTATRSRNQVPAPVAASTNISYWVEGGDAVVTKQIADQLFKLGHASTPAASATQADISFMRTQTPGSTAILESSVGVPAKLDSAKLVTASTNPGYYLSGHTRAGLNAAKLAEVTGSLSQNLKTAPANTWSLTALGDIIIGRTVYLQMRRYNDPTKPFAYFADTIRESDLAIADLECSISDARAVVTDGGMTFVSPFSAAGGLKSSGIDAVNLANNHSYNGGAAGFVDTLDEMTRLGVKTFGGGRNTSEARQPLIMTTHGVKVALLGYSSIVGSQRAGESAPGMNYISMAPWGTFSESDTVQMEADIKAAKAQADLVMVYYHWGTEYTHQANGDQRTVAHRAVDAGADLILGTHPHWVQGVEWYKDRLITYSLGNFIFDQEWSTKTKQGTFLKATFNGAKLTTAELVPYQIEDYLQPRPVNATTGQGILNDIYTHSWWPAQ